MKHLKIDKQMRDNWLALFEEIMVNGNNGMENLYAWFLGEQELIEQSIDELKML